ncbi:conserved hypothetical protein [Altererythrobacter sp. B11]|nr:conserved hypothetical protein [Altererythrobacter sp. B11]
MAFVLPAEFGVDPTGIGKATGLIKLAEEGQSAELQRGMQRQGVLLAADISPAPAGLLPAYAGILAEKGIAAPPAGKVKADRFRFELLPFEGIEVKYELAQGQPLVFAWQAGAPLQYDMHAHPYEGGEELTESYAITSGPTQSGVYVAPFTGIHGWYWQNRTLDNVTLTLDAAGPISASYTFDQTGQHERQLAAPSADSGQNQTASPATQ